MKRIIILTTLCLLAVCAVQAQNNISQGVDAAYEKALRKYKAEQKAKADAEKRKRDEETRRREQMRRQHEAQFSQQMDNVNSVSAGDFVVGPQGGTAQPQGGQQPTVATRRNANGNPIQGSGSAAAGYGRSNGGSFVPSGGNYTGDRFNLPRTAQTNNVPQQPRMTADQYKQQYNQTKTAQGQTKLRGAQKPARIMNVSATSARVPQKATATKAITTKPQASPNNKQPQSQRPTNQQPSNQQASVQRSSTQRSVGQQTMTWQNAGRRITVDTSKKIPPQQQSSPDLGNVDITKKGNGVQQQGITVRSVPNEAYYLSDRDNKVITTKSLRVGTKTDRELALEYRKDVASGLSSFDNPKKWERLYGLEYVGTIRTANTVSKKR